MNHRRALAAITLMLASVALLAQAPAPSSSSFTEEKLAGFAYRAFGPYRAGFWIADIAVPDTPVKSHLYTFYVGSQKLVQKARVLAAGTLTRY